MSFLAEKNWQTERPAIKERIRFMFNNDLFSDVKFAVRRPDGESESKRRKQVIAAHKFVLSISSPVFEAMFYGELAETKDTIELPDCDYDSLLELFRYMYSDEVKLTESNVTGVLYLAKKYMVPSLAEKCTKYLQTALNRTNAFSILPHAENFEEKNLVDQCWKVIDKYTEEAVKSDGFATIERSLLESVVERDTLNIEEIELFKAVNLWATKRCEEEGLSTNGSEKRRILGERIVKGIRFPVMTQHEFAEIVLDCKILTQDESFTIVKYLNSIRNNPVGFPETKRTGTELVERFCRFGSVVNCGAGYSYLPGKKDFLIFEVDRDISLVGVTLFGSRNCRYSVAIQIEHFKNFTWINVCNKTGNFSSACIQSDQVSYYGFNVFFDSPVDIKKGVRYHMGASISGGANSCFGENGHASVVCSWVTFKFYSSGEENNNGTKVEQGQFPGLLFVVK